MMDKQELIEKYEKLIQQNEPELEESKLAESRSRLYNNILRELKRMEDGITTEQAWDKIAEIFDDDDPDMLKDVCMNVLKAFNGGYPMLVTEGHICTWNPDVGKPEIPHWLAERTEEYNIDSSAKFWRYVFNGSIFDPEERAWILDNDDIINKMFLCGYTVKELAWVVKINKKVYFCRFTDKYFKENPDKPTYSESGNPEFIKKFTNKDKAEAVAKLINGEVEEWSE